MADGEGSNLTPRVPTALSRLNPHFRGFADRSKERELPFSASPRLCISPRPQRRNHPDFAWDMKAHLRTQLVLDALEMALWQRRPHSVIHHSGQGTQYTSIAFAQRRRRAGVRPPMGSVEDCFDTALCESFFASPGCDLLERHRFRTPAEARSQVFDFIEGFYNPHRLHSSLGYHSPAEF